MKSFRAVEFFIFFKTDHLTRYFTLNLALQRTRNQVFRTLLALENWTIMPFKIVFAL